MSKLFQERVWCADKADVEVQLGALGMLLKWELRLQWLARAGYTTDGDAVVSAGAGGGAEAGASAGAGAGASAGAGAGADADTGARSELLALMKAITAHRTDVLKYSTARASEHLNPFFDVLVRYGGGDNHPAAHTMWCLRYLQHFDALARSGATAALDVATKSLHAAVEALPGAL